MTGELWVADVGEAAWEEIDLVEKVKTYAWNIMEGAHCYNNPSCNTTGLEFPIYEYSYAVGNSITGGFVYRGTSILIIAGNYIYVDYGSGKIWALDYSRSGVLNNTLLFDATFPISSFGINQDNELYIFSYASPAYIYKIVAEWHNYP